MNTKLKLVFGLLFLLLPAIVLSGDKDAEALDVRFTGETLTLLYVTDIRDSVSFYKSLGFKHDYYDYQDDTYTRDWN